MNRVLVVAAHPDDEVLGCGGTIARHAADGDDVHVLFLADGETGRTGASQDDVRARQANARQAAELLRYSIFGFAGFPDNRLDGADLLDVIRCVEAALADVKPQIVYTHAGSDLNVDHQVAHRATLCRWSV